MDVAILIQYRLIINAQEFRIISKALRNTLTAEELTEAAMLQKKLIIEREKQAQHFWKETEKTTNNIKED